MVDRSHCETMRNVKQGRFSSERMTTERPLSLQGRTGRVSLAPPFLTY